MPTVDLNKFRTVGTRVFSGRKRGSTVREAIGLESLEAKGETITVIVPDDTIAFNPSFFLGLFGASVRRLGRGAFDNLYNIKSNPVFYPDIEEGKQRALLESNVLVDRPDERI